MSWNHRWLSDLYSYFEISTPGSALDRRCKSREPAQGPFPLQDLFCPQNTTKKNFWFCGGRKQGVSWTRFHVRVNLSSCVVSLHTHLIVCLRSGSNCKTGVKCHCGHTEFIFESCFSPSGIICHSASLLRLGEGRCAFGREKIMFIYVYSRHGGRKLNGTRC